MILIIGGSGFIGRAVVEALRQRDVPVTALPAPRVSTKIRSVDELLESARVHPTRDHLVDAFEGIDCIVNCAGVADARSSGSNTLFGANALLPTIVSLAAGTAGVSRLVHVSSAGVQGRIEPLDETAAISPISAYTASKALAERALSGREGVVIFRPTSVHGAGRQVTQRLIRFARTPAASVAGAGSNMTPQVLVQNVADAIATVCLAPAPPAIVTQPAEGLTVRDVLVLLGDREPVHLPNSLARLLIRFGLRLGQLSPRTVPNTRRLEMLWFGQSQSSTWLEAQGWRPPLGREAWIELARGHGVTYDERLENG